MIFFNGIGFTIAVGIFVPVQLICNALGLTDKGPVMIVAGLLVMAADLAYRGFEGGRRWFHPDAGGHLFLVPIWGLGFAWIYNGVGYLMNGQT